MVSLYQQQQPQELMIIPQARRTAKRHVAALLYRNAVRSLVVTILHTASSAEATLVGKVALGEKTLKSRQLWKHII